MTDFMVHHFNFFVKVHW